MMASFPTSYSCLTRCRSPRPSAREYLGSRCFDISGERRREASETHRDRTARRDVGRGLLPSASASVASSTSRMMNQHNGIDQSICSTARRSSGRSSLSAVANSSVSAPQRLHIRRPGSWHHSFGQPSSWWGSRLNRLGSSRPTTVTSRMARALIKQPCLFRALMFCPWSPPTNPPHVSNSEPQANSWPTTDTSHWSILACGVL